ncbi:hypothetical protein LTR62_007942 [Meristemomyces frigidus]|uniref:Transcription and mRNA export factor SUS1 n=1 Tax=Meristemomyces frigidus TaxID=1508187 RepID=A0AAN7TUW6_9PEZI|nr:hypothetical protein LTR62_007942 [Meristemomyces frigidus]
MAGKIQVNGTTSGTTPDVHSQITTALLQNGGVKRIQETLQQRLDEDGWTQSLRDYVVRLYRSGDATTVDEAYGKVMQHVGGAGGEPDLTVPKSAREGGAEVLKKELERICVVER